MSRLLFFVVLCPLWRLGLDAVRRFLVDCLALKPLWRFALVALILAVSYLALTPIPPRELSTGWDKLNHFFAFAVLTLSSWLAFPSTRGRLGWLCLAMVGYGAAIEVAQLFVPGRESEWGDLFADSLGVAVGVLMVMALAWLSHKPAAPGKPAA